MEKYYIPLLFVAVAALALFSKYGLKGGSGLGLINNQATQSGNAKFPSIIDTTNWIGYTNNRFGFSFKFPNNWPQPQEEDISSNSGPLYKQISFGNYLVVQAKDERYNTPYTLGENSPSDNWKNISINSYKAFKSFGAHAANKFTVFISPSLTSVKVVTFDYDQSYDNTIDTILSTFKFL